MTHVARTVLAPESNFHIALARVFGLGKSTALNIAEACGISQDMKVRRFSTNLALQKRFSCVKAVAVAEMGQAELCMGAYGVHGLVCADQSAHTIGDPPYNQC